MSERERHTILGFRVSPIAHRRWRVFKGNRRGFYSLWIFMVIFIISLGAEFIANDKPLMVHYDGGYYFPVFKFYPETTFGGDFKTEAEYREKDVRDLIEKKDGWMIWPLIRYGSSTVNFDLRKPSPAPPSAENLLGTDDQARDVFARTLYGFRISVLFGLILTICSSVVGITAGAVQGYFGGKFDLFFQRFIEVWIGLPNLFVLIILSSLIEPSFWWLVLFMFMFRWTALIGVVRAEFLRVRNFDFVRSARAMGATDGRIIFKHIMPSAMVAMLTYLPFVLKGSIVTLTSLDFLGFGLPPGSPSLGELLAQGKNNIQAPWLGITAFLSIALLLSLLIFIGEAVRDAFDPRKAA